MKYFSNSDKNFRIFDKNFINFNEFGNLDEKLSIRMKIHETLFNNIGKYWTFL